MRPPLTKVKQDVAPFFLLQVVFWERELNAIFVSTIAQFLPRTCRWSVIIQSLPLALVKYMEKNLGITKPRYRKHILPHPCPFVVSGFHSNT